jgi:N4-gp56 family major capsid protein
MAVTTTGTNVYTGAGSTSLGGTSGGAGLIQQAYDRLIEFQLRATPMLRQIADKRPANQSIPGSTVSLQIFRDLDKQTSTLAETPDIDAIAFGTPFIKNIVLNEYGNAAISTRKIQTFSLAEVDPLLANSMAYNMADSLDEVVQTELQNGTQVYRVGGRTTRSGIDTSDTITAASIRRAVAKLRSNKVVPRKGNLYYAAVHPEVSHDLRAEVGPSGQTGAAANWRDPHVYSDPSNIWAGEIGSFEGAYFVESPRLQAAVEGKALLDTGTAITGSTTIPVKSTNTAGDTVITFTTNARSTESLTPGDWVVIAGATPTVLNGSFQVVTVPSTTTFTVINNFASAATGLTFPSSGTVTEKVRVYSTYLCGQQALAEAVAEEPHTVVGPVIDKLNRFRPIGWYGILGFKVYREEALYRIESASSISTY